MAVGIRGGSLTSSSTSTLVNSGTGTFAAAVNIAGNGGYDNEMSVASADFNHDGYADLATVDSMNNTLSVRLNNGSGGFGSPTSFATDLFPMSVVAADFNGDGYADIAVLCYNYGGTIVSVYMNNGNGTFASKVDYNVGGVGGAFSMCAADVNGDGYPDLIVAGCNSNNVAVLTSNSDTVSVLRNTTSGVVVNFAAHVDYPVGRFPKSVTAADLNGDGKPDLAVANFDSSTISVLTNNSSGSGNISFQPQVAYASGYNPVQVIATDINKDGHPDLVTANALVAGYAAEVAVYRCQFLGLTGAGFVAQNWNTLNWFFQYDTFDDCYRGLTNLPNGEPNTADAAGCFYAYDCVFIDSTDSDIALGNTGYFVSVPPNT